MTKWISIRIRKWHGGIYWRRIVDEHYAAPFFRISGVKEDGTREAIAERETYQAARAVLAKLLPGIGFPEEGIAFGRSAG